MAARKPRPSPPLLILIGAAHLTITTLTWRDISRRPSELVRGRKLYWRIISAANTMGSLLYFLFGRKKAVS
jgi:hypothetical protein